MKEETLCWREEKNNRKEEKKMPCSAHVYTKRVSFDTEKET